VDLRFPEPTDARASRAEVFLGYLDYFRERAIGKVSLLPPTEVVRSRARTTKLGAVAAMSLPAPAAWSWWWRGGITPIRCSVTRHPIRACLAAAGVAVQHAGGEVTAERGASEPEETRRIR
jgi:hypothetical protein